MKPRVTGSSTLKRAHYVGRKQHFKDETNHEGVGETTNKKKG